MIGVTLDNKYTVLRVIGRGGMGVVYEAEHAALNIRVAIKLMLEKYTNDSEAMARFTREAHAASRIGSPHIIQVLDVSTAPDGRAFVVMELLQGKPLARVLEEEGALPPQRAIAIMRQVLRAVSAAHAKGIIHRDLKPDNIFLLEHQTDGGRDFVKLLDFGISKIIDPDLQAAATKLTTTGVVMGTPLYMAPEQAMGAEIDHHADIYACGVMLYEMLAGRPPFEGATYAILVAKMLTTEAPLLSEVRPTIAPKLVAAVHRALEKAPHARYPSADAFAAALPAPHSASAAELAQTKAGGRVAIARKVGRSVSGRKAPILAVSLAMLAGIGTATVIIVKGQSAAPSREPAPAATQPAAPTEAVDTGRISVGSEPRGATLQIDGTAYGSTPIEVTIKSGKHRIQLTLAGFDAVDTIAEVNAGEETQLFVPLKAANAPNATKAEPIVKTRPMAKKHTPSTLPAPARRPGEPTTLVPPLQETPKETRTEPAPLPPPPPPIKKEPVKRDTPTGPRPNPYNNPY